MKSLRKPIVLGCLLAGLSTIGSASTIWNEVNAGGSLAQADITTGNGVLTDIIGKLGDTTGGADMYEIYIQNPVTFSATTTGPGRNGVVDPALYLFDTSGNGLFGNDNRSGSNTQARIPAGTLSLLSAGEYFLLIAPSGHVPEDKHNVSIFGALTGTTGVDAGSGVLKKYGGTPSADDAGKNYDIVLTGADFAVPEPATFAFTILGLTGLAWRSRRRKA